MDACTVQESKTKDADDFKLPGGGTLHLFSQKEGGGWWVPGSWYFHWPASVNILDGHIETLQEYHQIKLIILFLSHYIHTSERY